MLTKRSLLPCCFAILFSITDKLLRQYLNDILCADGRFADSSFNSNIVSLSADDLLFLLTKIGENTTQNVTNIRESIEKGNKSLPKTVTEALKDILKGFADKISYDNCSQHLADFTAALYDKIINKN